VRRKQIHMANKFMFVRCKVLRGLFDTEYYVIVSDSSAYVSRSTVRVNTDPKDGAEVEGQVEVFVVEEDNEKALIELPGEPVVGGLRTWVPKTQIALHDPK